MYNLAFRCGSPTHDAIDITPNEVVHATVIILTTDADNNNNKKGKAS